MKDFFQNLTLKEFVVLFFLVVVVGVFATNVFGATLVEKTKGSWLFEIDGIGPAQCYVSRQPVGDMSTGQVTCIQNQLPDKRFVKYICELTGPGMGYFKDETCRPE